MNSHNNPGEHDGDCHTHTTMGLRMEQSIHCCACWNATDDKRLIEATMSRAVEIFTSSGNRDTAAFRAADAYLARMFSVRGESR